MLEKTYKKDEIIFRQGDTKVPLYKVIKGKIFNFAVQGSKILPLWETGPGSFIGENSIFLKKSSQIYCIAMEDTSVIIFTEEDLNREFPKWLLTIAIVVCKKTEEEILQIIGRGIKRPSGQIKPLSIDEQRRYLKLINLI